VKRFEKLEELIDNRLIPAVIIILCLAMFFLIFRGCVVGITIETNQKKLPTLQERVVKLEADKVRLQNIIKELDLRGEETRLFVNWTYRDLNGINDMPDNSPIFLPQIPVKYCDVCHFQPAQGAR
jgi:hypothetical protein